MGTISPYPSNRNHKLAMASGNRYPTFFIPGAQKSGTSTFAALLAHHPNCEIAWGKEPSVFARAREAESCSRYQRLFSGNPLAHQRGDASTSYMTHAEVPTRIRQTLGENVKFIFLLRDPSERALSAYRHLSKRLHDLREPAELFSRIDDLEAASKAELAALGDAERLGKIRTRSYAKRYDDRLWPFRYLYNSSYSIHLQRYLEHFSADRILVVTYDELQADAIALLKRTFNFLGLDEGQAVWTREELTQRRNVTLLPRRHPLLDPIHRAFAHTSETPRREPLETLRRLYRASCFQDPAPMDESLRQTLKQLLASEVEKLRSLTGLPLGHWG